MGKPTGFMEITRQTSLELPPEERIRNFNEFHVPLHTDEQQAQGARCMDCGVPFCQSGVQLGGMFSGCPLNNLIPEWNDLVYQGKWDLAVHRLIATSAAFPGAGPAPPGARRPAPAATSRVTRSRSRKTSVPSWNTVTRAAPFMPCRPRPARARPWRSSAQVPRACPWPTCSTSAGIA